MHITNEDGRARSGVSPVAEIPASKGKNLSLLQGINNKEVIYYEVLLGPVNAITCERFLKNLFKNVDINSTVLVMDNARIHHSLIVQEYCETIGVRVLFLPPYSPFLNPIELSFGKIKKW